MKLTIDLDGKAEILFAGVENKEAFAKQIISQYAEMIEGMWVYLSGIFGQKGGKNNDIVLLKQLDAMLTLKMEYVGKEISKNALIGIRDVVSSELSRNLKENFDFQTTNNNCHEILRSMRGQATKDDIRPMYEVDRQLAIVGSKLDSGLSDIKKINDALTGASKGKTSEIIILDTLKNGLSDCDVNIVSGSGHCGDIHVQSRHGLAMIEVKNYARTIPKNEVEKFYDDINTTSCDIAIMLAVNSGIIDINSIDWREKIIHSGDDRKKSVIVCFIPFCDATGFAGVFAVRFAQKILDFRAKVLAEKSEKAAIPAVTAEKMYNLGEIRRIWASVYRGLSVYNREHEKMRGFVANMNDIANSFTRQISDACNSINNIYENINREFANLNDEMLDGILNVDNDGSNMRTEKILGFEGNCEEIARIIEIHLNRAKMRLEYSRNGKYAIVREGKNIGTIEQLKGKVKAKIFQRIFEFNEINEAAFVNSEMRAMLANTDKQ